MNTEIKDMYSIDGIHIAHSDFKLYRLKGKNSLSDILDIDWSYGTIQDSTFENCGKINQLVTGDCIDVSSSNVTITDVRVYRAADKGISIGEGAVVELNNITSTNGNIGIAVKDDSSVHIKGCQITGNKYGILKYIKKPEYVYPTLSLENCSPKSNEINQKYEDSNVWTRKYD